VHEPTENERDDTKDSFVRNRSVYWSVPEAPYKNIVTQFQCKIRERRYFQTNNREW